MVPVTKSDTPLVPDTLPALKVRHYCGGIAPRRQIYSFARLYMLGDALSLSLYGFEREPEDSSRLAFAFCAAASKANCIIVTLAPQHVHSNLISGCPLDTPLPLAGQSSPLAAPAAAYFAGVDEQGWYWGASILLPAGLVRECGSALDVGTDFYAAVFKYDEGKDGFGASFLPPQGGPPVIGCAEKFTVVIY